jgi:hypothetical protein
LGSRRAVLVLLAVVLGCVGPVPPAVPVVSGPGSGQPQDTLRFLCVSTDRNGGNLCYLFDWGDSTPEHWSAEIAAGDTLSRFHLYYGTGVRQVTVKCRDEGGLESDWSAPASVELAFRGPLAPDAPEGPGAAYEDTFVRFVTSATHVRAESVQFLFDWGDTIGQWTGFCAAGQAAADSHLYRATGGYLVRARARDRAGNVSPWSASESLTVTAWPLERPGAVTLRAASGTSVRLHWQTGRNSDSTTYRLWFRPLAGVFSVADSAHATSIFHDPIGWTGDYTISAVLGGEERFALETLSTAPVASDSVKLFELNVHDPSGLGWDTSGYASAVPMRDSLSAGRADLYFTDLTPGSNGPIFYLASPHIGPDDPGEVIPDAPWRRSGLLQLFGNAQDPLPEYDSLLYSNLADVSMMETFVAVHTANGYYGLTRSPGVSADSSSLYVRSWFQRVRGLRLIRHAE